MHPLVDEAPLLAQEVPHIHTSGVIVCGHAMADSEENIAIGVEGFLQTWLEQVTKRLQDQLARLKRLAVAYGPSLEADSGQAGSFFCTCADCTHPSIVSLHGLTTVCGTD